MYRCEKCGKTVALLYADYDNQRWLCDPCWGEFLESIAGTKYVEPVKEKKRKRRSTFNDGFFSKRRSPLDENLENLLSDDLNDSVDS